MKGSNVFWVGFSDLLTSLFFIVLIIAVFSIVIMNAENQQLKVTIEKNDSLVKYIRSQNELIKLNANKYEIIKAVEKNIEVLRSKKELFIYEPKYKRYKLAFNVQFKEDKFKIVPSDVLDFLETKDKISQVGNELKSVVEGLIDKRIQEPDKYKNISYLIVVTGSSSRLPGDNSESNYLLSYRRAYYLYNYWRNNLGIDFDDQKYHEFIEFQIAGSGEGGVGRYERLSENNFYNERKNQRFLINVIPKIGEL